MEIVKSEHCNQKEDGVSRDIGELVQPDTQTMEKMMGND